MDIRARFRPTMPRPARCRADVSAAHEPGPVAYHHDWSHVRRSKCAATTATGIQPSGLPQRLHKQGDLDDVWSVCDVLRDQGIVLEYADELFAVMERLDDAHLGSPGALVHALESTSTAYRAGLIESVERKPSGHTVTMVNRIMNSDPPDYGSWLELLERATAHPRASNQTREYARDLLEPERARRSS